MGQNAIRYICSNEDLLDIIEPLWRELNEHHNNLSLHFKHEYDAINYEVRKGLLQEKAREGFLRIELVENVDDKEPVGYCVSSVDKRGQGEIDSIFVKSAYRGMGIGGCLMEKALGWMDELETKVKTVHVAAGNEAAFGFYARYGFLPRQTILKQKN